MQAQKSKGATLKNEGIELNEIEKLMFMFADDDQHSSPADNQKDSKTTAVSTQNRTVREKEEPHIDSHESNLAPSSQQNGGRP